MDREDKKLIFLTVEKLFRDEMDRVLGRYPQYLQTVNICCDDNDEENIMNMSEIIKTIPEFRELSYRSIYAVLIMLYYSLRLQEHSWLSSGFMKRIIPKTNYALAKKLYLDIALNDIIFEDGGNLSSAIRRYILGMCGGKTRSNKRSNKRSDGKRDKLVKTMRKRKGESSYRKRSRTARH